MAPQRGYNSRGVPRHRLPPKLLEVIIHTSRLEASDERDYVYGMLALTDTPFSSHVYVCNPKLLL